jgi:hypothetical protein
MHINGRCTVTYLARELALLDEVRAAQHGPRDRHGVCGRDLYLRAFPVDMFVIAAIDIVAAAQPITQHGTMRPVLDRLDL